MAPLGPLTPPRITRRMAALAIAGAIAGGGGLAVADSKAVAAEADQVAAAPATADSPLLDPQVYSTLTTQQRAAVDRLRSRFGDDVLVGVEPPAASGGENARAAGAVNPVAGWFAQELLSWGAGFGLDNGYDALASAMGWGGSESAMAEVNASLQEISAQYTEIQSQLERLADEVVWNTFSSAHLESEEEANEIMEAARDIAAFERLGAVPTEADVSVIATATRDAMADLGATLLTSGGAGSIPALVALETHTTPVSDTEDQWERVLAGVDSYRSVYAQGVMSMLWAAQYDDEHGANWTTFAKSRAEAAKEKVTDVYDYLGAPYPQRPGDDRKWVHSNGADWALQTSGRPTYLNESRAMLTERSAAEPRLSSVASNYRPNGGGTLQEYLTDRGFTHTTITYADDYGYDRSCPWSCRYSVYLHQGRILDNNYDRHKHVYWQFNSSLHESDVRDEHINPNIAENAAEVRSDPRIAEVDVPVNPRTGMPALMDEESIRAQRDGLEDLVVTRGKGDAVSVAFSDSGYDSLQVARVGTDDVLKSFDLRNLPNNGSLGAFDAPNGAVELRVGYSVDGDHGLQDTRATSVVATNPGENSISLERGKPYVAAVGDSWEIAPASSKHVKISGRRDHVRLYTHTPIELRASGEDPNLFSLEESFHTGDYPSQPPNLVTAVRVDDLNIEVDPRTGKISGTASGTAVDMQLNPIEPTITATVSGQVNTDFNGDSRSMRLATTLDKPYQELAATDLVFRPPPS